MNAQVENLPRHLRKPDGHRRLRVRRIRRASGPGARAARLFPQARLRAGGAPQDPRHHHLPAGRLHLPDQRGSGFVRRRFRRRARPERLRFRDPRQQAGRVGARAGPEERRQADRRQGTDARPWPRRSSKGIGGCMLYIVDRYDDKGTIHDPDYEWIAGRRDEAERLRADLHRPSDPQPVRRQHGQVVGILRAPVQLPRNPLLRHQGRQDRPAVEGDDRAGRHGAHSAQRIERSEVADQRVPRQPTTARASSTSPASPTTSTRRWRRCARAASSSWTPRTPTST